MARVLNDFTCPNGHTTEHFVDSEVATVRCDCGLEATKVVSQVNAYFNPFSKNPTTKASLRWAKQRERKAQQERKANQ